MKILFAATPIASHLNPLLSIARMVLDRNDEAIFTTGAHLRQSVEAIGAQFRPLASGADFGGKHPQEIWPERATLPAGPAQLRFDFEHIFLDPISAQTATLRAIISDERPDVVVTDVAFMGRVALFLDPMRPSVPLVSCGISALFLDRPDGAPFGLGLAPALDDAKRDHYAALATEIDASLVAPTRTYADAELAKMALPPLPCSVQSSMVLLADAHIQPTVAAFEYDFGDLPPHIRFVGALPPPPSANRPLPAWWEELDGNRHVVLVTQGTVANADFSELVEPTLAALADRDDTLVIVTTGDRPVTSIRGSIPTNARLAKFLDYGELLPKLAAVVTNGGYGTVSLALRVGVPIVAAGRTEDKAEVGARVAWSGVGIEIPSQRPSIFDLREAVERVLFDSTYRTRAREIAADMAAIDTRAEILTVFDALVARKVHRAELGEMR